MWQSQISSSFGVGGPRVAHSCRRINAVQRMTGINGLIVLLESGGLRVAHSRCRLIVVLESGELRVARSRRRINAVQRMTGINGLIVLLE
jgi:hypothetical protein